MARMQCSNSAWPRLEHTPTAEKHSPEEARSLDGGQPDVYQPAMPEPAMRGFFAIGAEGISKPMNLGNLIRSAHAFGASFVFLVNADYAVRSARSDTSQAEFQLPVYDFASVAELQLPRGCRLVGCELVDDAVELPSFRHPPQRRLCVRARTQLVVPGDAGALPPCGAHPDAILHQSRCRRRGRDVRPRAVAGTVRAAPAACRRARSTHCRRMSMVPSSDSAGGGRLVSSRRELRPGAGPGGKMLPLPWRATMYVGSLE